MGNGDKMCEEIARAKVLVESLPYMREFSGSTVVIKYGGHAMVDEALKRSFALDVILMKHIGINPVIVHGGGPQINRFLEKMQVTPSYVQGMRVTDGETMDVVEMVLVGKVNKEIVTIINAHGGSAVGLSGEDARLITAGPADHLDENGDPLELGYVGKVKRIDTSVLDLLAQQAVPVVASVAADETGQTYNINADTVAGELAAALHAEKIVFLSDVGGIYSSVGLEETVVSECTLTEIGALQAAGGISGGMIPKVAAVRRAVEAGVTSAHIIDGRVEHALLLEILTDAGCGTKIVA